MEQLILPLLAVSVLASLASVGLQFVSWLLHNSLANRVAKLEALQQNSLTNAQTIRIYERLSSMEALVQTQGTTLETIKQHLLESDS